MENRTSLRALIRRETEAGRGETAVPTKLLRRNHGINRDFRPTPCIRNSRVFVGKVSVGRYANTRPLHTRPYVTDHLHCDLLNNQSQLFEIRSSKEIRPIVSLILSEIVFRCEIKQRFDSVSLCTRFDSVEGRVRTTLEHDQRTIVTFVFLFIVNKCDLHRVSWVSGSF